MKSQNPKGKATGSKKVAKALPGPADALASTGSRQLSLPDDVSAQRQAIMDVFLDVVAGRVLSAQMKPFVTSTTEEGAARGAELFVEAVRESVKPRDALEEMLVVQMAWTHARLARLSAIAHNQEHRGNVQVIHDACDQAANTFRRQMLALAEYRRPAAQAGSFVAIRQANVANQQVVQNVEAQSPNRSPSPKKDGRSNEQGSARAGTAALPAVAGGAPIPPGGGGQE
jgi:hypothetical protein